MKTKFARLLTAALLGAFVSASSLQAGNSTVPGTATAQARSSTQIVVEPPFTGDDNGNGYTVIDISTNGPGSFDYSTSKLGGTPLWRIAAMPALPGQAHYVRVTHIDPDGVSGQAVQVLGPITTPASAPNAISLSAARARVRASEIEVSCDVTNDANQNSTFRVEVATSASGPWIEKCGPHAARNPRRARVRSLEPGTDYWVRVTVADPDGVVGTNPQVIGPLRYTGAKNLAFNRPVTADGGWGCCPTSTQLTDGRIQYDNWYYGFAWTGGLDHWAGGPEGIKQAAVDLGAGATFNRAAVWIHDPQGTPLIWGFEVSNDGASWNRVYWNTNPVCRSLTEPLHNDYWADPGCAQEGRFPTVTARYLRYLFDDRQMFNRIHGWAVELEVFHDAPQASIDAAYVANWSDNTVTVIARDGLDPLATIPVGTHPYKVISSPDGRRVFVSNRDSGSVSFIDTAAGAVVATVAVGTQPAGLAVSPDNQLLYVVNSGSANMSVIDIPSATVINTVLLASSPASIAYHPQRAELWIGYGTLAAALEVRRAGDFSVLASIQNASRFYEFSSRAFTPDGACLWTAENCGCCGRFHKLAGTTDGGIVPVLQRDVLYDNRGAAYAVTVHPVNGQAYLAKSGHCGGQPSVYEATTDRRLVLPSIPRDMTVDSEANRLWITLGNGSVLVADLAALTTIDTTAVGLLPEGIALAPFGPAKPDLSLTQTVTPNPVTVGSNLTVTLTVSNAGQNTATGVQLTDKLPAFVSFVTAVPSQGSCEQAGGVVTCDLGSLANDATATVTVVVRALCEGSITNTAAVTANETDSPPGNNTVVDGHISIDPLYTNYALNRSGSGFPSPLESDRGWGGGSYPWHIVDGAHSYNSWANGLAFTGGHTDQANPDSGGYIEPAGPRQTTINFGSNRTIEKVVIWHHGEEHTPAVASLDYWNGSAWINLPFTRFYARNFEPGQGSGSGWSDEYYFSPVTGSKVRYSFDNRERNILGTWNIHGWLYEFEALGRMTPPIVITEPLAGTNAVPGGTSRLSWQANCPPDARWSIELIKGGVTNQLNLAVVNNGGGNWYADWSIPCAQMEGSYLVAIREQATGYAAVSGSFTVGLHLNMGFCVTWPDTACARQFVLQEADSPNGPWRDLDATPLTLSGSKLGVILDNGSRAKFHRLRQP